MALNLEVDVRHRCSSRFELSAPSETSGYSIACPAWNNYNLTGNCGAPAQAAAFGFFRPNDLRQKMPFSRPCRLTQDSFVSSIIDSGFRSGGFERRS
jgi:hypothetical protein